MRDRLVGLELADREGVTVATLDGEIDGSNASELRLAISERLPSSSDGLVLDICAVTYLDSAGVQLLFELGRRLAARRQAVRLVVSEDAPTRRVLELCDIGSVAPMDATLARALEAIEAGDDAA
ncbi:MAG: STAS domain-containing protein, partial [Solirubrobacterales bacterium]